MEYAYATLILNETGAEINEQNLTAVLEAAGVDVVESRVKAIVAALEGVDVDAIDPATAPDLTSEGDALAAVEGAESAASSESSAAEGAGSAATTESSAVEAITGDEAGDESGTGSEAGAATDTDPGENADHDQDAGEPSDDGDADDGDDAVEGPEEAIEWSGGEESDRTETEDAAGDGDPVGEDEEP